MVSGVERFREQLQIVHPDHMLPQAEFDKLPIVEPVYPLTAGLSAKVLMKAIQAALPQVPELPEWQEEEWLKKRLVGLRSATQPLHRPENMAALEPTHLARARLAYDELLAHQLVLALVRRDRKKQQGRAYQSGDEDAGALCRALLPFPLTGSQESAISDIAEDMAADAYVTLAGRCRQRQDRVAVMGMCKPWPMVHKLR